MMNEIQDLLDAYHAWLKDRTALRRIEEWVEITTPYLDRHNDYLQIYAKRANGGLLLTDDGYTIEDLEQRWLQDAEPEAAETAGNDRERIRCGAEETSSSG